ncbi:MAG TPA: hypothetical protein EYH34_17705 [Planctomycetes bacterium]|nr:hypothetical protein [Planctomycetota bacterium]
MCVAAILNRGSRPTCLLRENHREGGKVKTRTLGNISHPPDDQIQLIRCVLKGQNLVPADGAFEIVRSLPHGHVQVVLEMIHQLDLPRLVSSRPGRQRDLIVALVAQWILHPGSKPAATRLWKQSTAAEELGVENAEVEEVYEAMDGLVGRRRRIENNLARGTWPRGAMCCTRCPAVPIRVGPVCWIAWGTIGTGCGGRLALPAG